MNKSKFLKKSLAMLLALMLVVAMIPLSAAAEATVPQIYVNSNEATLSGTTYSVTTTSTTASISCANATVVVLDKNMEKIDDPTKIDLTQKASVSGNVYTLTLRVEETQDGDDATVDTDYTLNITVNESAASSETGIQALKDDNNGNGNLKDMVDYTITGDKITIWTAFGKDQVSDLVADNFKLVSNKASVTSASITEVVVQAEDKASRTYTVELKTADGFTSFTVPNQTKDSVIKAEGKTTNTVDVEMPYDTETTIKAIPTFTVDDAIIAVTTNNTAYDQDVVTSGKTEIEFTYDTPTSLYLWYGKESGENQEVQVTLKKPTANPEGILKTITVTVDGKTSNETTVSGNTVNVEMPNGTSFDGTKNVSVTGTASANAKVSITAPFVVSEQPATKGTFAALTNASADISGKAFTIKVVSEDGDTTNYYTVKLSAAATSEAKLNDFSVKYTDSNNKETTYTASNNTLTLPYAAKAELGSYKVYVQTSTGASVEANSVVITKNGEETLADLNVATNDNKITVKVKGSDGTVATTTITVKYESAKTARTISSGTFVGTANEADITADNTYSATVGTAKDSNGDKYNTIKVNVPYSFVADTDTYLKALGLSNGATAYLQGTSTAEPIYLVGDDNGATAITFDADSLAAVDSNGVLDTTKAIKIYVVSEKVKVDTEAASDTIDNDWFAASSNASSFTTYYVYGVNAEAETGSTLTSIKSTVDTNVTASLSGKTITITVPNSYDDSNKFTLNFTTSKLATLEPTATHTPGDELKSDNGSADSNDATKFYVDAGELKAEGVSNTLTTSKTGTLYVISESGKNNTPYTVKLVVADAETGASLTGVKVNNTTASISGKNVNVNLPFGTKLYPVKLTLTASKMADILVNGVPYNADKNYDLNSDITIKVTSEDKATTNVYTLKATIAEQFSDIDEGDWYYNNVLRAVDLSILSGYSDGTFKPNNNITRRDFAIMLAQALGHSNSEPATSPFKDVADNDYGVSSIAYLYEQGITAGDDKGNFNPDANITRQEAAIFLAKAFEATGTSEAYTDDAKIASWAKDFVYAAKAAGLMSGDVAGTFRPTDTLTRAEAASAMVNAVDN